MCVWYFGSRTIIVERWNHVYIVLLFFFLEPSKAVLPTLKCVNVTVSTFKANDANWINQNWQRSSQMNSIAQLSDFLDTWNRYFTIGINFNPHEKLKFLLTFSGLQSCKWIKATEYLCASVIYICLPNGSMRGISSATSDGIIINSITTDVILKCGWYSCCRWCDLCITMQLLQSIFYSFRTFALD